MVRRNLEGQRRRALQRLGELFSLVDEAMRKGSTEKARHLLDEVRLALRAAREGQPDRFVRPGAGSESDPSGELGSRIRRISTAEVVSSKQRAQRQR